MYGMIFESVQYFVQKEYGEEAWKRILNRAGMRNVVFHTQEVYSDRLLPELAEATAAVTGDVATRDQFLHYFGRCFVRYCGHFGYDKIIMASGRYMCEFLNGMDNIHQQMRLSYPRMRSPSMYVTHMDNNGAVLSYRSSRVGLSHYLIGQLVQIAKDFYQKDMEVIIMQESEASPNNQNYLMRMRLNFDNSDYLSMKSECTKHIEELHFAPVTWHHFLKLFPFCFVFDATMTLLAVGTNYRELFPNLDMAGQPVENFFNLRRPRIPLSWKNVMYLQSIMCEMGVNATVKSLGSMRAKSTMSSTGSLNKGDPGAEKSDPSKPEPSNELTVPQDTATKTLILKGEMRYMDEWKAAVFLCSPVIGSISEMAEMGIYFTDLSLHGHGREMIFAGQQNATKLQVLYEQAGQRSGELKQSYDLLDEWKSKGEGLLYSMLPQSIAERLKSGECPMETCKTFDAVTIMFCEMMDFAGMVEQNAMDAVTSLNTVFSEFDRIMDRYTVYKVETIGNIYMAVSGAPDEVPDHAKDVAETALDLIAAVPDIDIPSGMKVHIRAGIHSGPVVAGVVGMKVPHYCFFGDTVNTSARMQTTSMVDKVHISLNTYNRLMEYEDYFETEYRGTIQVKGKGKMDTYWLLGRKEKK